MKTQRWLLVIPLVVWLVIFTVGQAAAANGNLRYVFKHKDPATGVEQNLVSSWAYLRSTVNPPPMEKVFSKADHILWGSYGNGLHQVSVPEGTYYLRINQRKIKTGPGYQLGPPEEGDYTWVRTIPITIVANQTLNLGTLYAVPFASAPITITGTVKSSTGVPKAGQYVRAQTEPCLDDGYSGNINQCGPVKNLALQPTDANGNYTLQLKNPGTYYIYTSPCLTSLYDNYTGNRCDYTAAPGGPFTVTPGANLTVNIPLYQ